MSHAQISLGLAAGAARAEQDFPKGVTENPFLKSAFRWEHSGWRSKTESLVCARDHDASVCCPQHHRHFSSGYIARGTLSVCSECPEWVKAQYRAAGGRTSL